MLQIVEFPDSAVLVQRNTYILPHYTVEINREKEVLPMYGRERMRLLGMVVVLMLAVGAWCSNIYSCIDSVNGTVTPGAGRCSTTVSMSTGAGVVAFCSAANNPGSRGSARAGYGS